MAIDFRPTGKTSKVAFKPTNVAPTYAVPEDRTLKRAKIQSDIEASEKEARKQNAPLKIISNTLGETLKGLTSAVGLGESIGKIFGDQGAALGTAQQTNVNTLNQLRKQIRDTEAAGKDATKLKRIYNDISGETGQLTKDIRKESTLPTTEKAAGQLAGTALDVLTAGTYGRATQGLKTGALGIARPTVLPKPGTQFFAPETVKQTAIEAAKGGAVGYAYDVTQGLQGNRGTERDGGEAFIPGLGTALGTAIPIVGRGIPGVVSASKEEVIRQASKDAQRVDDLAGQIIQGKKSDIEKAKQALFDIDTSNIKTYSDLKTSLKEKVGSIANKLDAELLKDTRVLPLADLDTVTTVGNATVRNNYVDDAIDQLTQLYAAINDPANATRITQLRTKAANQGLTVKEVNDLAREHGIEFGQKAFSTSGEPLTSVNAQAFENTRKGLKTTARRVFDNPIYAELDDQLANAIRIRTLANKMEENVNKLRQRVTERGWGEKTGRLVFQALDIISGGTLKGFVQAFVPRSAGLKILNALDLERSLQTNLEKLQNILQKNLPEAEVQRELGSILSGGQSSLAFLTKKPTTINTASTVKNNPINDTIQQTTTKRKIRNPQ